MQTRKSYFSLAVICCSLLVISCGKSGGDGGGEIPNISINDISINEGNAGNTAFDFEVTLSKSYSKDISFQYRTVEGTAKHGQDLVEVSNQSVTIKAGEMKKTITVQVITDDLKETDEDFSVTISNVVNANVIRATGKAIIKNDDTRISIPTAGYDVTNGYPGYTLSWADEFNTNTLDPATWTYETGDGCPNLCGWGNNELEYYTNSPENLFFQDGKMIIQAKQEAYGGKNYTSARIKTEGKKLFKFGRIDVRAALPSGKGIWPAFWLLPQSSVYGGWPRSGEIDLMEFLGHETNKVYGTAHYGPGPGSINTSRSYSLATGNFHDQFHVFSLEWVQDELRWYVDGNLFSTVNKSQLGALTYPFNENFYLLINLAVGGNWPGAPDATTTFPQYLVVDYVRVYQIP